MQLVKSGGGKTKGLRMGVEVLLFAFFRSRDGFL